MNIKQRMIDEMFKRIRKGPARTDVDLYSKKHFAKEGGTWKPGLANTLRIYHWRGRDYYDVELKDYENNKFEIIAEDFKSWKEAFNWVADYILNNDF